MKEGHTKWETSYCHSFSLRCYIPYPRRQSLEHAYSFPFGRDPPKLVTLICWLHYWFTRLNTLFVLNILIRTLFVSIILSKSWWKTKIRIWGLIKNTREDKNYTIFHWSISKYNYISSLYIQKITNYWRCYNYQISHGRTYHIACLLLLKNQKNSSREKLEHVLTRYWATVRTTPIWQ